MSKNKVHTFCHSQNITEIQSSAQTSYKGPSKGLKGLVHITHKEDRLASLCFDRNFSFCSSCTISETHHNTTTLPVNPTVPYKKIKSQLLVHLFDLYLLEP